MCRAGAWQRLSAGEGAKGPRLYDWVYLPLIGWRPPSGWQKGLLIRRKLAQPEAFTFYLTLGARDGRFIRSGSGGGHALDHRGLF